MRHSDFLENVYRLFFSAGKREAQASGTCFSLVRRASSDIHEQADRIKPSNHPQASRQKESRRREGRRLREKREEGFSYGVRLGTSPTAVTVDMFYITARPLEERCFYLPISCESRNGNVMEACFPAVLTSSVSTELNLRTAFAIARTRSCLPKSKGDMSGKKRSYRRSFSHVITRPMA